ncbi:MAG: hypothetical protein HQK79_11385 [Desulfobacterales bacterium]|nr:hypothetical protein [Desulfobacterales bacterium]
MEKASKAGQKPVIAVDKEIGKIAESPSGPVGLDIGTSFVVAAENERNHIHTVKQLNAFFTIPKSKFAKSILLKNEILFFEQDNYFYIFGFSADNFAHMFNTSTKRSINSGILSNDEKDAITVVQAVILSLINRPKNLGETLCFAIPGEPLKGKGSVVYHESVIKRFLGSMGYAPITINEAMAVVLSELSKDDYTGIGISMGGGMCNICLSYLSFPVITYSIQFAGDYIDSMAGLSVNEPATKIKSIKEEQLDLLKDPKDRILTALHVFYEDLIIKLLDSLQRVLFSSDQIPMVSKPIPIVLSGGTSMPRGLKERFERTLKRYKLPVEISEVRMSEDPLNAVAKGALLMAMTEMK